jgi:hypothetical protein
MYILHKNDLYKSYTYLYFNNFHMIKGFWDSISVLGFWTLSIVRNSITRKHNVSETGTVSILRWRGGDLLYKEPRKIELRLTLTTGDVKQQEDQLSKQGYYKHLI